ncbi:hypothetical protein HDU67_009079 [Dinochytrium kinnereticum]|nr:hypothetical protein HDU67_009079 [Dinochytrium kinnereticum]
MTLFIPQWDHNDLPPTPPPLDLSPQPPPWHLDLTIGTSPGLTRRWDTIQLKFNRTCLALYQLQQKYSVGCKEWEGGEKKGGEVDVEEWVRHAMVLANIAARRTDDPKLGG